MGLFGKGNLKKEREAKVKAEFGCIVFCPHCDDILNDQAEFIKMGVGGHVKYVCQACKGESYWDYGCVGGVILKRKDKQ